MQWDTSKIHLPQDRRCKCNYCNSKPSQYVIRARLWDAKYVIGRRYYALCHKHRVRRPDPGDVVMNDDLITPSA